jgi:hypothetical protein
MEENNSKKMMMNGNTGLTKFSYPISFKKKVLKVKLEGATLQCQRVKQ